MHFGQRIKQIKNIFFIGITVAFASACHQEAVTTYRSFITPASGTSVALGKEVDVNIQFGKDKPVDSVVYFIDSNKIVSQKDTADIKLKTDAFKMGNHLITAKIYKGGESEDLTSNINILAAKAPVEYTYKVIKTLPHDTSSYVEGLEYHDGFFYESAGSYGASSLRKVEVNTGKVIQKTDLDKQYFGEGITVVGNKIIQLTYREKIGFVYDKATLKKLSEFPYTVGIEGWGLAFDGERILNTDSSNTIYFLDKDTYQRIGSIDVFDDKGPINQINELEYIDGKIYANVYTTNNILIIDPKTGAVEGKIDLSGLLPNGYFKTEDEIANNVLNGIAYDKAGKRLFVAGKKWPSIFQIQVIKK